MKYKYSVKGMSCSACSASVEKVVRKIDGVISADVNLTQEVLTVESEKDLSLYVIKAISKAGFKAYPHKTEEKAEEPKRIKGRLIASVFLLLFLMYVAMHEMLSLPFFKLLSKSENVILYVLIQLLLTVAVIVLNLNFFIKGTKAIIHSAPNMDTLVSLGSGVAFIYGIYSFVNVCIYKSIGDTETAIRFASNLYLESSAMILTLVTVGKYLESLSKKRTESAAEKLKKLAPKTSTVLVDGKEREIEIKDLLVGDIVVLKEGNLVPSDGIVINGNCEVDESNLTGESVPIFKGPNSAVKASSICISGYSQIKVTAVNEDTEISKIIDYILSAEASKAPVQRLADKVSGVFVPTVIAISLITFIIWFIITSSVSSSMSFAISVLVISCPCALGLATPIAVTVATGRCANKGILIKDAEVLENVGLIKTALFDKTGTLTEGKPIIGKVYGLSNEDIKCVASIESMSSHPLSTAVTKYAGEMEYYTVDNFLSVIGKGVIGKVNGVEYKIGSLSLLENLKINDQIKTQTTISLKEGKTVLFVSKNDEVIGYLEAFGEIKKSSHFAIKAFEELGVKTVIVSGDDKKVVNLVKEKLGVYKAYGEVSPKEKAEIVKNYETLGNTMFIGDGVNDSPALTVSSVGVSVSSGTDIAVSSSHVILLNNNLENVVNAVKIGKKTRKIIKQNLFWAFFYNVIGIPLAAGVFFPLGITLSPMIASALMSISSIFVVTNALRLQSFKF
ncbi:MAG: cadmium-translocating P-type ATPase [Clostridia bacterium]|nr:cadmium-translocating P-type ATPase [Clostridia bacterium]